MTLNTIGKSAFALIPPKVLLLVVAVLGIGGMFPNKAEAGGYTVYIYNTRTNSGWFRSGFAHDVYTTFQACVNSINTRVSENKRYGSDFEKFAIVYHNSRPPSGRLTSYVTFTVRYNPPTSTPPKPKVRYYCLVSYTYKGRVYSGYLGGYPSYNHAIYYYNQWARGIGARYRPRLHRVITR